VTSLQLKKSMKKAHFWLPPKITVLGDQNDVLKLQEVFSALVIRVFPTRGAKRFQKPVLKTRLKTKQTTFT
jgi:hypothetical protein